MPCIVATALEAECIAATALLVAKGNGLGPLLLVSLMPKALYILTKVEFSKSSMLQPLARKRAVKHFVGSNFTRMWLETGVKVEFCGCTNCYA